MFLITNGTEMSRNLGDRTIVVTGGTKGIGRATVKLLAGAGARVFFQGRDEQSAEQLVAECGEASIPPEFVPGDLHVYDDVARLLAVAAERAGPVSGLVASGGGRMPRPKPLLDTDPALLGDYFPTRGLTRILAARAAAEHMKEHGYGKIVMLTSDAGRVPTPSEALVGAACASVIFFARAAARELVQHGIRINAVSVSLTEGTPSHDAWQAAAAEQSSEVIVKAFNKLTKRAPFGISTSEEIAEIVSLFLSPETDGITGATLSVNRGTYFPVY
jgi:2-hydroxycyclohexanecarboxyl-CoA dehydrogenase